MLRQASVSDLVQGRASRESGYVAITMRRYPRQVRRELRDEYLACLSPSAELHRELLAAMRSTGDHDGAFASTRFEERFELDEEGWAALERLSELARRRTVYLVCQCPVGARCHREALLLLARELFGAKAELPKHAYPKLRARIPGFRRQLRAAA